MVSLVIRLAATTQPVCKSALKYSTVYPINGDTPLIGVGEVQLNDTEELVTFNIRGVPGGPGNLDGSGVRWIFALADFSTVKVADHDVSPLSEDAVHVYRPESPTWRSTMAKSVIKLTLAFVKIFLIDIRSIGSYL